MKDECKKLLEQLPDYLDEQESEEICRIIKAHLELCPTCQVYVDSVQKTIKLYQSMPKETVSSKMSARLMAALAQEYGRPDDPELRAASD